MNTVKIDDFLDEYKNLSQKDIVRQFNEFSIKNRKKILLNMDEEEQSKFISSIRKRAVKDFWTHEQALIKEGKCTRDWTPEQIEDILNISEKTRVMSINGEAAVDF